MNEDDIAHIMRQDFTMTSSDGGLVAASEGKPHPRFYGTYPRKIARYVRERGVVSLPHAIRSMTSLPATVFGIADRGSLREGAWADIVVFDLESFRDRATYHDPHQLAEGAVHVLVNGQMTGPGVLAGRVLRPDE
jgi:N-acyl-D-aspartate/D-glutamate deacylase